MDPALTALKTKTSDLTEADLQQVLAARDQYREAGDEASYAQTLGVLAHVVKWVRSDTDADPFTRAQELSEEALAVEQRVGDPQGLIDSLIESSRLTSPDVRAERMAEATRLAEELDDPLTTAKALAAQASFTAMVDRAAAGELYRQAMAIYEQLGLRRGVARCLHGLAILLEEQPERHDTFMRASHIYQEEGDLLEASRWCLAGVKLAIGKIPDELLKREALVGLDYALQVGSRSNEELLYSALAKICARLGEKKEAAQYRRWAKEMESADGLTPRERANQRRRDARAFGNLAKAMSASTEKKD